MAHVYVRGDLVFFTISNRCGSQRLPSKPANQVEDVMLVQYIFRKLLKSSLGDRAGVSYALIDNLAVDGVWGPQTDYIYHYFLTSSFGEVDLGTFNPDYFRKMISHTLKPLKASFCVARTADRGPMALLSALLCQADPNIKPGAIKRPDMPRPLQKHIDMFTHDLTGKVVE